MPTLPPARTPFGGRESHQAREIAESFGSDADRYDRARPRYPDELVDRIVAGAAPGQHRPDILDVGCGTGIVARQFQAAGCRVLGVDPDARMADLARRHGLEVEVSAFEAWPSASSAIRRRAVSTSGSSGIPSFLPVPVIAVVTIRHFCCVYRRPGLPTGSGGPRPDARDPGFHGVRARWIRGFMAFRLARR